MAIILRSQKGSQLTYAELDGNFTDLDVRVTNATTIAGTPVVWGDIEGKPTLFDGNYSSLNGAPVVPINIGDLNNVSDNVPDIGQVLQWSGTEWFPGANSGFDGDYTSLTNKPVLFDGQYSSLSGRPTIPADVSELTDSSNLLTGAVYTDSSVDTHLNQSSASASEVLSWNGTDYAWVAQAGSGSSYTDSDAISAVTGSDLDMSGNKVLFGNVYSEVGDLPDATNYHGMFAHVHATGAAYFAHGGNWVQLANNSDLGGGGGASAINDLTDVDTATTAPTANQVLKWNTTESKWLPADDNGPVNYGSRLVWDLTDPNASEVLNAGTEVNTAWYYGDVVSDPANPTSSVVLDIDAATPTFTGNVMGEVHGDVKTADGGTLVVDVDNGLGQAEVNANLNGDVTGDITSSGTSTFTGTLEIANLASVGTGNLGFTSAASVNITASDDVNINGTANFDSIFKLTPLSAAPVNPAAGTFAVADNVSWDPASSPNSRPYPVFWDGAIWNPLY